MKKINGAFIIHKPVGVNSSHCVTKIKYALLNLGYGTKKGDAKLRIGHGGTLDPFASGVLVILVGEATKLADTYLHSKKTYTGVITLGSQTTTGDHTGEITARALVPNLDIAVWNSLAKNFTDDSYLQIPPMYSAKKIDGVALHSLARQGIEIAREAILKKIFNFKLDQDADSQKQNELVFVVECEGGTYVRTLAEDLAKKANTLAHLKVLCRTQSSDAGFEDAVDFTELLSILESGGDFNKFFRPLSSLGTHVPEIEADKNDVHDIYLGKPEVLENLCKMAAVRSSFSSNYILVRSAGEPLALLSKENKHFRVQRIFNETHLNE